MNELKTKNLLDLSKTEAAKYFDEEADPFDVIGNIEDFIIALGKELVRSGNYYKKVRDNIWLAHDTVIDDNAVIMEPAIIGPGTHIRHNAYIRGNVIIGANCVVGNATEIKNSILFDGVEVPHFNYVGDSILGYKVHFGAGAITANSKSTKGKVVLKIGEENIPTNLTKLGAVVGDYVELGCNTVLNPGTVIGPKTTIYPGAIIRGYVKPNRILKLIQEHEIVEKWQGE